MEMIPFTGFTGAMMFWSTTFIIFYKKPTIMKRFTLKTNGICRTLFHTLLRTFIIFPTGFEAFWFTWCDFFLQDRTLQTFQVKKSKTERIILNFHFKNCTICSIHCVFLRDLQWTHVSKISIFPWPHSEHIHTMYFKYIFVMICYL